MLLNKLNRMKILAQLGDINLDLKMLSRKFEIDLSLILRIHLWTFHS